MKITQILSAALFLLLSSCGSSTDTTEGFSTQIKDFMIAGNHGTEIVYTDTRTSTDSSGKSHEPSVSNFVWTVMERDVIHPKGGMSIRLHQEDREVNTNPSIQDSVYLSLVDNSVLLYTSIKDASGRLYLKAPVTVGAQWIIGRLPITIKSVGQIVNTTYGPLKAVLAEGIDSTISSMNQLKTITVLRIYLAPEVLLARVEQISTTYYPNNKISIVSEIVDLTHYTKK